MPGPGSHRLEVGAAGAVAGEATRPPPPADRRPSVWAPLAHRLFLALWLAQLVSNVGTWMQNVAAVWLMGTLGGGALLIALVQTATSLPVFLVGVPAGALADIVDRRRLLLATQALMLAAAGGLAVFAWTGGITPWLLLLLTFALGTGSALNMPAWQAIQPELVPAGEFRDAVALNSVNVNVGRALGPAIGGAVVAAAGPTAVFVLNALSFVGVMAVLARWPRPRAQTGTPPETLLGAVRAGFRYGRHSRAFRAVLARTALFVVPASAVLALLPIVARGPLRLGAGGFGVLLTAFGAGAVVSAVALGRVRERLSVDATINASMVAMAVVSLAMAYVHSTVAVAVALLVGGVGWVSALATLNVAAQGAVPEWVRARGMGLYLLVFQGGVAAGSAAWGAVAAGSLTVALVAAASTFAAGLLLARRWPLREFERLDLSTAATWAEPVVVLEPRPGSGPVLVTLAYQVAAADVEAFVEAMTRVRRVRQRTGAHRWSLYRDTAEPDCFLETFVVDSWEEHLRQHARVTATDQLQITGLRPYVRSEPRITHYVSAY
jgi:MFS family permease